MARYPLHLSRRWTWLLGSIASVLVIIFVLSYLIQSDYLRRYVEGQMNHSFKGYTVRVGRAYFHPLTFSLDLKDLTLSQDANPDPPIARIGGLYAGIHWRELLTAHLVGDLLVDHSKLYINLKNIYKEEESEVPLKKKGWQEAVESIYPLKINVFRIEDGELTYVDEGPYKPLQASRIYLEANNIQNIRFQKHVYPSTENWGQVLKYK